MTLSARSSLDADLRLPHEPVLVAVLAFTVALVVADPRLSTGRDVPSLAAILFTIAGSVWLVGHWRPASAPWLAWLLLAATLMLTRLWCGWPGLLTLLAIPTALAGAMISPSAAMVAAVIQSALLGIWLSGTLPTGEGAIALIAVWAGAGLVAALFRPVRQFANWSWEHYALGQQLLEEARERQSQLKDTLDALAYANQQLDLANQRLAAMRKTAEEAERSKAAFVANVSHEFRTPLNIIIGLAELLMDAPTVYGAELPPAVRRDIEVMHRNSEHLASLVNDVLDLSQVETGKMALQREWVDLPALVRSAVAIVEPLIREKTLPIELQIPSDVPTVYCDPRRIRQVVLNLVSNAARFTEQGGITVTIQANDGVVRVSVRDTGPGLTEADRVRVFEPFNQGGTLSAMRSHGSGLGLSISRQFVEMHQGTITLESAPGVGSEFAFTLPIEPPPGPREPAERWISDGWEARRARARVVPPQLQNRLMLVDTVGDLQPVLERYAHDVTLVPAHDLEEAQERMATAATEGLLVNAPTVAALWPALEAATRAFPDTPVVGCVLPAANAHALAAGARGYLTKPLNYEMLAAILATFSPPPRRILLVDDDPDALDLMSRLLSRSDESIDVLTADTGQSTLACMLADTPDLVLLDIVLPEMVGWQVLQRAQNDERLRRIPVVLVSAQDPRDEPLASPLIVASMAGGLSLTKVLRCSQTLAGLLMQPD
ncbi:MAG: hybrid sensor histidine kinase/response regulator [Anaerolineales bacterium]